MECWCNQRRERTLGLAFGALATGSVGLDVVLRLEFDVFGGRIGRSGGRFVLSHVDDALVVVVRAAKEKGRQRPETVGTKRRSQPERDLRCCRLFRLPAS